MVAVHIPKTSSTMPQHLAFLDDNDTKEMIFMKITAEVEKMNEEVRIYCYHHR